MKKILAIAFVLMLFAVIVGCAKTSQVEDKSQEQDSEPSEDINAAEQELNDLNSDDVDSVEKDLEDFNW